MELNEKYTISEEEYAEQKKKLLDLFINKGKEYFKNICN